MLWYGLLIPVTEVDNNNKGRIYNKSKRHFEMYDALLS